MIKWQLTGETYSLTLLGNWVHMGLTVWVTSIIFKNTVFVEGVAIIVSTLLICTRNVMVKTQYHREEYTIVNHTTHDCDDCEKQTLSEGDFANKDLQQPLTPIETYFICSWQCFWFMIPLWAVTSLIFPATQLKQSSDLNEESLALLMFGSGNQAVVTLLSFYTLSCLTVVSHAVADCAITVAAVVFAAGSITPHVGLTGLASVSAVGWVLLRISPNRRPGLDSQHSEDNTRAQRRYDLTNRGERYLPAICVCLPLVAGLALSSFGAVPSMGRVFDLADPTLKVADVISSTNSPSPTLNNVTAYDKSLSKGPNVPHGFAPPLFNSVETENKSPDSETVEQTPSETSSSSDQSVNNSTVTIDGGSREQQGPDVPPPGFVPPSFDPSKTETESLDSEVGEQTPPETNATSDQAESVNNNTVTIDGAHQQQEICQIFNTQETNRHKCLFDIGQKIKGIVEDVIDVDNVQTILMAIPEHFNLGDSFIAAGELALLDGFYREGVPIGCVEDSCFPSETRRLVEDLGPNTTLYFNGGGNFGDLWRDHSEERNSYVRNMTDARIVFAPQSVWYNDPAILAHDVELFRTATRLTMLFRDYPSMDILREAHVKEEQMRFCPDMAFMLGPLTPIGDPIVDVVVLSRSDKEKLGEFAKGLSDSFRRWDQLNITYEVVDWEDLVHKYDVDRETFLDIPVREQERMRLEYGIKLLSLGRIVVTDRLHAVILSTLLGKPHVFMDNSYRKIFNVRNATFTNPECSNENLHAFHIDSSSEFEAVENLLASVKEREQYGCRHQ
ncbi:hypothetical protein HK102_010309 [Quaeritorhiza haematococci]|nr:hypothetical protein HK102_010309 [Quaeritorhiza haematococci]